VGEFETNPVADFPGLTELAGSVSSRFHTGVRGYAEQVKGTCFEPDADCRIISSFRQVDPWSLCKASHEKESDRGQKLFDGFAAEDKSLKGEDLGTYETSEASKLEEASEVNKCY
jgi:hypothetical protein